MTETENLICSITNWVIVLALGMVFWWLVIA